MKIRVFSVAGESAVKAFLAGLIEDDMYTDKSEFMEEIGEDPIEYEIDVHIKRVGYPTLQAEEIGRCTATNYSPPYAEPEHAGTGLLTI